MSVIAGMWLGDDREISQEDRDLFMLQLRRYSANSSGEWREGSVLFACRHQWITPESRWETLPYADRGRGVVVAADAILDNREELFLKLQVPGELRKNITDSELILLAYERWGEDAPAHLIGDFAFVIWDERRRCLFGARDPLGNRTLYLADHAGQGRFAFCTAIRPLLSLPDTSRSLDETWLAEYLAIPSMLDSADSMRTAYATVRQLPPAHRFVRSANGQLMVSRFGSLLPTETIRLRSDAEYVEAFRNVFRQAVQTKIRTYREVGASLSGGLDSGTVAGFSARALGYEGKVLHTYSYVPPKDFVDWTSSSYIADERPFIQETVRHIGNIDEHYLEVEGRDPYTDIDTLLDIREMPYKTFENGFWVNAMYEAAEREGAGVLLTGAQGNHTISWGSAIDYYALLLIRLRWMKLHHELKSFSRRMHIGRSQLLPLIGKGAAAAIAPGAWSLPWATAAGDNPAFPIMIHPDFAARTQVIDRLKHEEVGLSPSRIKPMRGREHHFGNEAIHNLIGTSGSKFSLRYGLWERDPTADHRVIRFCLALPPEQYVSCGLDRALVRRATHGELPDRVRLNQRYRGVQGVDWVHRMRSAWPAFLAELRAMCGDSLTAGLLNIEQVKASLANIGDQPKPELAMNGDARFLMRCLIVYRFLKRVS